MELAYWRKHPNLQGWMESLWHVKGNDGEFNCEDLELTLDDLDNLEKTLDNEALPETAGFSLVLMQTTIMQKQTVNLSFRLVPQSTRLHCSIFKLVVKNLIKH